MFSTDHQCLQDHSADHVESWNIHLFSEFSSEFSCLSDAKENEEKQHDMSNWNSMHSHQKKALLKKTELLDFSHCYSSSQISTCWLNSVLNLTHRKHTKQATKFCKKKASSQIKSIMSSQKIILRENKNIRISLQDVQIAQKTIKTQSFIAIQLQSDKTKLAAFLHQKRVLSFFFFDCFCRWDKKMSKHIMIHCIKHSEMHRRLKTDKQMNLRKIMFFLKELQTIIAWWLKQNLLSQFQLAWELKRCNL